MGGDASFVAAEMLHKTGENPNVNDDCNRVIIASKADGKENP